MQYETGLFRERGQFGSLPNSELNISPIEGTTEGVIVADIRVMGYGVLREERVTIEGKKGEVANITGGRAAEYLKSTLESLKDPTVYNLAEFGIGLNPMSRIGATNQEDLGRLGFAHHGLGSNYAIGGNIAAPCHIDVTYSGAVLHLDGRKVLEDGKLLL